jgi:hypothetical protein
MRKVRIRLIPSLIPLFFVFMGFTLLVTNLHGQAQEAWVARYGGNSYDIARDIAMDEDGNVYVTGSSRGSNTSYDYATLKYDRSGNQLWVARYNGPAWSADDAYAIAVDASASVYVTGRSWGVGTERDIVTIKYDTDGNLQWVARYDGPDSLGDMARAVAVDGEGNVYVTGYSVSSENSTDCITIKYDTNGSQVWASRYDGPGNALDEARDVALDPAGNVYVTGNSLGEGTLLDYVTIKYDPVGNELWVARYDSGDFEYDKAKAIDVDGQGNSYVTGIADRGILTIKYDTEGKESWTARHSVGFDTGKDIIVDDSGNVFVTGYVESGTYRSCSTIGYDPDGNELWIAVFDTTLDANSRANYITLDDKGDMYVTGRCSIAGEGSNFITIKYDNEGSEIWVRDYDGTDIGFDEAWAVCVDGKGNVYVTGESEGDDSVEDYVIVKYRQNPLIHWEAVEFK